MPRTTVNVYPSGATLGKRTTNQRRSDQNSQMATLGALLPFPEDSALTKDKISVIRLTGAYLKFQKFLQDAGVSQDNGKVKVTADGSHKGKQGSSAAVETESQLFVSLLSKALDGFIMIVDPAGTVLFVSSDAADYISLTPSEITGHSLYEVSHHDDDKLIKKNLTLNNGDIIEANQVWRQFCVRVRSSMSGVRSQVTRFGGFNMIHVSGFLKLLYTGGESSSNTVNHAYSTVSSDNVNNYQVIGLVAECHLIESPVIMELSVQHSTFTSTISLDLKFNSVDTRVTQFLGFDKDDLVGQKIFHFFHPKEYYRTEHFVCWKRLMCQGQSTSPVYRFLTKNGEWIWMQMSATLTYIPNTKIPYAANYTFRVINAENSETGKYKLVEHSEEYVMESNSCLPEAYKFHFPKLVSTEQNSSRADGNRVVTSLENTPLSEVAKEAFFHARNVGLDTFLTGIQPASLEDGTQPVKMVPDYTENATLDSVFVPPTMSCTGTIPYGPDLYAPSMYAQNDSTNSSSQSLSSSLLPSPASSLETAKSTDSPNMPADSQYHSHNTSLTHSPSSGYVSSPGDHTVLHNHNTVIPSSQQLESHNYSHHPQHSSNAWPTAVSSQESFYQNVAIPPHSNMNGSATTTSDPPHNNSNSHTTVGVTLPEIDPSVFDSFANFDSTEANTAADLNHQPIKSHLTGTANNGKSSQHRVGLNHNDNGLSPYNYANSSIDNIIDQLIRQMPDEGDDINSYPDLSNLS